MQLTVQRGADDGVSIQGQLLVDGIFNCYTLEPSYQRPTYPAIPAGTYPVQLLDSPRFGMVTPHLQSVPGRSFVEIHPGNDSSNTEGCLLVGETYTRDWVGSSRVAFQKLMTVLETATDPITITYIDYPAPDVGGEIGA